MTRDDTHISSERDNSLIKLTEEDFQTDLIDLLTTIYNHTPPQAKEITKVCQTLFSSHITPFYDKWKSVKDRVKKHTGLEEKFYSILVDCKGIKILTPYRFLVYFCLNPKTKLFCSDKILTGAISPPQCGNGQGKNVPR